MAHDILIVDDEDDIRMLIAGILEDEGYETREADTSAVALSQVGSRRPSLIILDIWLEGSDLDGMQLLETLQRDHPHVPIVMISGHGSIEMAVQAIKMGAYDFIEKPFKSDRLLVIVSRAIEAARLRRENEELKLRAGAEGELTGKSTAISQLRQAIEKAAPTGSRVLISGSAGSGKEVVARMLHKLSHRTNQPFVVINCATMAPESLELELFGSEAGTTGAGNTPARVGLFEQAHAGTLLLDEVGDMPLETQGKIVRALRGVSGAGPGWWGARRGRGGSVGRLRAGWWCGGSRWGTGRWREPGRGAAWTRPRSSGRSRPCRRRCRRRRGASRSRGRSAPCSRPCGRW